MLSLVGELIGIGRDWLKGRRKIKQVKLESEARIEEAKAQATIEQTLRQGKVEASWDQEALRQMQFSWKDEYLTLILTIPFIGSFIPVVQDYVKEGWVYIQQAPLWYQWGLLAIVCASFGVRWAMKTFFNKA